MVPATAWVALAQCIHNSTWDFCIWLLDALRLVLALPRTILVVSLGRQPVVTGCVVARGLKCEFSADTGSVVLSIGQDLNRVRILTPIYFYGLNAE